MSQQERAILIGLTATILAAFGFLLGYRALTGGDSVDQAATQFVDTPLVIVEPRSGAELSVARDVGSEDDASERTSDPELELTAGPTTSTSIAPAPTVPVPTDPAPPVTPAPTDPAATDPEPTEAPVTEPAPTDPPPTDPPATEPPPTDPPATDTPPTDLPATVPPAGLSAVELEIFRLTNELRANPGGALARTKPMPACVDESFYTITIDPTTGHPLPVAALTLSEPLSLQMARPWSVEMDQANTLSHRPAASAQAIYGELGVSYVAAGENVAWFSGYPDSEAAAVHFRGWVESDTGHYCALVTGRFSHLGVGHHKGTNQSWATQNFYALN